MVPLMAAAFTFLAAAVILPYFAGALQFNRIYHDSLLVVAPCLVFGVTFFVSKIGRIASLKGVSHHDAIRPHPRRVSIKGVVLATILITYFLFTSGWVWAVTYDRPTSRIFDAQRMKDANDPNLVAQYYNDFITDSDIAAALWLRQYRSVVTEVCSDETVRYSVLTSYGGFARTGSNVVRTLPGECNFDGSYVYLSGYNNVGMFAYSGREGPNLGQFSISKIWPKLVEKNRVFSDGAAIYS
jgi:uncharacterized membrane protein